MVIVGNLTADPELRYTQSGLPVANFTVASTERVFNKESGKSEDGPVLFMRCSLWREFAENVAGSLTKGTRVIVSGSLKQSEYKTKEGETRTSLELDVDAIGPDLRFATVSVTKVGASGTQAANRAKQAVVKDEWEKPEGYKEVAPSSGGGYPEETPF
jgi:single-strand DNA-binding protein